MITLFVNGQCIGTVNNQTEGHVKFQAYVGSLFNVTHSVQSKRYDLVMIDEHGARVGSETMYG